MKLMKNKLFAVAIGFAIPYSIVMMMFKIMGDKTFNFYIVLSTLSSGILAGFCSSHLKLVLGNLLRHPS